MFKKLLATVAVIGAAASIAGLGTFATFTSTAAVDQAAISTGSVSIGPGVSNTLTVGASDLVPGDSMQRVFDLKNTGPDDLASITLTTTAAPSSALDTDAANGLQMQLDTCSAAWTQHGSGPYTYTCDAPATQTTLVSKPVIVNNQSLSGLAALTAGSTSHLLVTLTLPTSAGNSFENISSQISYTFTGTQRNGTNK